MGSCKYSDETQPTMKHVFGQRQALRARAAASHTAHTRLADHKPPLRHESRANHCRMPVVSKSQLGGVTNREKHTNYRTQHPYRFISRWPLQAAHTMPSSSVCCLNDSVSYSCCDCPSHSTPEAPGAKTISTSSSQTSNSSHTEI